VVWLTGASSGIGEALAHTLAKEGALLVLTARREEELRKVQAACERPDAHVVLPLDLLSPDTFDAALRTVLDQCNHIDVLLHCAGVSQRGRAIEMQMKVDRHLMEVNHFAPVALTKLVLPSMVARKQGHIVVISSLLGRFSTKGRSAYCASKHAIIGFCDSLRAETYEHGIAVTTICPGFVRTNTSFNALTADGTPYQKMDEDIHHGMSADECARQIVRAIQARKREVYIGQNRWAVYLNRYLPGLFAWAARRRELK